MHVPLYDFLGYSRSLGKEKQEDKGLGRGEVYDSLLRWIPYENEARNLTFSLPTPPRDDLCALTCTRVL